MMRRLLTFTLLLLLAYPVAMKGQQSYFVDGYHGGVFGHYPLDWYTDFMIGQLEANPAWCINLEIEPETWDSVYQHTPDAYARFGRAVSGRQVEVVNPAFAQPYLYNISGESIIRHFQAGMRKWRKHFPDVSFLTYSSEEPCFTSCLPTVLRQLGFRYVVLKCPDTCWGGYMAPMGGEFIGLAGPDGTVLPCVPRYDCEALQDSSVWQTTAWKNSRTYIKACADAGIAHPVGMCLQDAGWKGGPWLKAQKGHPSEYILWRDYFSRFLPQDSLPQVPFHQENVRPALIWGSQVLQRVAQAVRKAENSLEQTERLCAMAALAGKDISTDRMEDAWRTLMLSQHHDSWIVPYNRLHGSRTWADFIVGEWIPQSLHISDSLRTRALQALSSSSSDGGKPALLVVNTTGQPRSEWLTVALPDGGTSSVLAEVPAFGYATIPLARKDRAAKPSPQKGGILTLENDCLRLQLDLNRGGIVRSLRTKDNDAAEYVTPDADFSFGELRGFFGRKGRFCSSTEEKASAKWLTKNEAQQSVIIEGKVAGVPFQKTITLRKGSSLIDVALRIEWQGNQPVGEPEQKGWPMRRRAFYDTRFMLNLLLPTNLGEAQLTKDAPFDVCTSLQHETFFNRWDSIRHNIVLHWLDVADGKGRGLALFTDHTTSYSFGRNFPLALTLQYSGPGLWGRGYPVNGPSEIRYALMPHQGRWDEALVQQTAQEWQEPLLTIPVESASPHKGRSFIGCSEGLRLSAATMEDGLLTLRLFNDGSRSEGRQTVTLGTEVSSIEEVDLRGEVIRTVPFRVQDGLTKANLSLPRLAIVTYRIAIKGTCKIIGVFYKFFYLSRIRELENYCSFVLSNIEAHT